MLNRRGNRVCALLLALLFLPMVPSAVAQTASAGAPQKTDSKQAPTMEEEIIVTGRHGEPDFQEQQEYHAQEYRRLKQIYDPDPLPVIRGDRLVRMPETISSTVQGKPTLTEKQW